MFAALRKKFSMFDFQLKFGSLVLVILPPILVIACFFWYQWHSIYQQNKDRMEQVINIQYAFIEDWLLDKKLHISQLSKNDRLLGQDKETIKKHLTSVLTSHPEFFNIYMVNKEGTVTVSVRTVAELDVSDREYFKQAAQGKEYISNVIIGRQLNQPIILFSAPVYDTEGNFTGAVIGTVALKTIDKVMHQLSFGQTGEIYLVNEYGETIIPPRLTRQNKTQIYTPISVAKTMGFIHAMQGESGTAVYKDYRNIEVLGTYRWYPERKWAIISEIDTREIYQPFYESNAKSLGIVVLVLALVYPAAWFLTKRVCDPLISLMEAARQIREGCYGYQIKQCHFTKSPLEFQELCRTFNKMSLAIKEQANYLTWINEKLEEKVAGRTTQLSALNIELSRQLNNLQQKEEKYRVLFNGIDDAVFVCTLGLDRISGNFMEVNDVACERLGYTREELLQMSPADITPPEELAAVLSFLNSVEYTDKTQVLFETTHVTKYGQQIPVEINMSVFTYYNQLLVLSTVRDITARKRHVQNSKNLLQTKRLIADISQRLISGLYEDIDRNMEKALEQIGRFVAADFSFILLFDNDKETASLTHVWRADSDNPRYDMLTDLRWGDFTWWMEQMRNNRHISIPDVSKESEAGDNELAIIKQLGIEAVMAIPMFYNTKLIGFLGFACLGRTQAWVEAHVFLLRLASQILSGAIERHRSYQVLQKSETINRALLNAIPDLFFRVSKAGKYLEVRAAKQELLLLPPEEYVGKDIQATLPEQLSAQIKAMILKVIDSGNMEAMEYSLDIHGRRVYEEARITPLGSEEVLIIVRDVTARVQASEKEREAACKLNKAQEIAGLGVMAGSMAHEINQPLNSIKVSTSGLQYLYKTGRFTGTLDDISEIMEAVDDISCQVHRVEAVVQTIRAYMRKDTSEQIPIDVNEAIAAAISSVSCKAWCQDIAIKAEYAPDLPSIIGNPTHLNQIIFNLTKNAVEALNRVRPKGLKQIAVSTYFNGSIVIEFSDNGPGFDKQAAERIFEPLFSTKHDGENMGLGLSIVKSIVESLGGNISAYNQPEGGACFRIEFPVYQ